MLNPGGSWYNPTGDLKEGLLIGSENMAVQVAFLKSIVYFSGLSPDELDSIKRLIFEKAADRGEVIMLEGEPPISPEVLR